MYKFSIRIATGILFLVPMGQALSSSNSLTILPFEMETFVGEEVSFLINSHANEEAVFSANHLPFGITLDPETGLISGAAVEPGVFHVVTQEKSPGFMPSLDGLGWKWTVLHEWEEKTPRELSYIAELSVGQDLTHYSFVVPLRDATVIEADGLPEGVSFNKELVRLEGSFSTAGFYEVVFTYKHGPGTVLCRTNFIVQARETGTSVAIPTSTGNGTIVLFNDTYFFPGVAGLYKSTNNLSNWDKVDSSLLPIVLDIEVFKENLLCGVHNGLVRSNDGETFDLIQLPGNPNVHFIASTESGILALAGSDNGTFIYYSIDLENWTEVDFPYYSREPLVVGNEFFFAERDVYHVLDENLAWKDIPLSEPALDGHLINSSFGDGKFACTNGTEIYYSQNGVTWENHPLPEGADWNRVLFAGGKIFIIGREDGHPITASDRVLISDDGYSWEFLDIGINLWQVKSLAFLNDNVIIEEKQPAFSFLKIGAPQNIAFVSAPPYLPLYKETYIPIDVEGSYDSLKALGLVEGLEFDENLAVLYGSPPSGYTNRDVAFVPVTDGLPGVVSTTRILTTGTNGRPEIGSNYAFGEVGISVKNESPYIGPYSGPDDESIEVELEGQPDWLSYDHERRKFAGVPAKPQVSTFTVHASNQYGSISEEMVFVVTGPEAYPVIDMEHSHLLKTHENAEIELTISGPVSEFEMYGLPEGMSWDRYSGKIAGISEKQGRYSVLIIPRQFGKILEPFRLTIWVVDEIEHPRFTQTELFITTGDVRVSSKVDYPVSGGSHWSLSSTDLPQGVTLDGFSMIGPFPSGIHTFTLDIFYKGIEVVDSREFTMTVSHQIYDHLGYQPFQLRALRGVPITESLMFKPSIELTEIRGFPDGLLYNAETDQIIGTPRVSGIYPIEISFKDTPDLWYLNFTVEESVILEHEPVGVFDPVQQSYVYEAVLTNPQDAIFQWLYNGEALTETATIQGVNTSKLILNDLDNRNPNLFSVAIQRNASSRTIEASYQRGSADYERWTTQLGLSGEAADPLNDSFNAGIPNFLLFSQDIECPHEYLRSSIQETDGFSTICIKTSNFWDPEQLRILVSKNLDGPFIELIPELIGKTDRISTWGTTVFSGDEQHMFFKTKISLPE